MKMTEIEAVRGWLTRMQQLTGFSEHKLLDMGGRAKSVDERIAIVALCVNSCILSMTYGDPAKFAEELAKRQN